MMIDHLFLFEFVFAKKTTPQNWKNFEGAVVKLVSFFFDEIAYFY